MISSTSNYLSTIIDNTIYYAMFDENSLNINILREKLCIFPRDAIYIYILIYRVNMRAMFYLLKILISSINFAYIHLLSDIIHHKHAKRNNLQTSYKINYLQLYASCIRIEISGGKIRPRTQSRILPEIIIRCIQPCKLSTKAIPRRPWWRFPSRFPLLTMSCNIAPILSRKDSNYTRAVAKCKVFFPLTDWFFSRLK